MTATTPPGHVFQFVTDTGNGQQFNVSGSWPVGVDEATMNADIDKMKRVGDRLRAIHEAPLVKERVEGLKQSLEIQQIEANEYDRKHPEGSKHRDPAMLARINMALMNAKVEIAKGEVALAETLAKIG